MKSVEAPSSPRADQMDGGDSATPQPYGRLFAALAIAGLASALVSPAAGAIAYNQSIIAIFGSGNPNGGWTSDTANGVQLALRAKARNDTAIAGTTPNNGAGTYLFPVFQGARGPFNYEFSINSDVASGSAKLSHYDFYLAVDGDPSQGVAFTVVNPVAHWVDNSFGDNATANGAGVEPANPTSPLNYNVVQASQNITFNDYPGGAIPAPGPLNATYTYELFAVADGAGSAGARLASVRIKVVVGTGGALPPAIASPTITNIQPSVVAVNTPFTVSAQVTGGAPILAASYSIDGVSAGAMNASDAAFGGISESVEANFGGLPVGVYTVSVSAIDAAGHWVEESTLLAIFDPSAGFVTGGGWINSPAGAFTGPTAWQALWDQGFTLDTVGWFDNSITGFAGYGVITALGDGTAKIDGLLASDGKFYGPFSRFDGYHGTWSGTWIAEIDVYLNPTAWAAGKGFDYSVASSNSSGAHLRDFIFHITKDTSTGKLLVAGSNNTNFAPREDLDTLPNHYEVVAAGWYTLQHRFHEAGGVLAVDLNLVNSSGQIVFTETRSTATDLIPSVVGGNRYAWFTHVTVPGGIIVDNHQRFGFGPTYPTGRANFGFVSRYKKGATVPEGSTEFVFQAGGLNFHSSAYDWLVVNQSGTNAQFKGAGRINSAGNYGFMIWASDNGNGGSTDTFRIRIVNKADGDAVVYDNGVQQTLGGGNIMIQTKK